MIETIKEKNIPEITLQFHKTNNYGRVLSSKDAADLIRSLYPEGSIELQEQAIILYLNRASDVIGFYRHSVGGIHGTVMDVKLIIAAAIKSLSSGIILSHNHPSGNLKPSDNDYRVTREIRDAAKTVEINLLDHLIITKEGFFSFSDEGTLLGTNNSYKTNYVEAAKAPEYGKENKAREAAKKLIGAYVLRGDTVEQIRKSQMGTGSPEFSAMVKGNKISVWRLNGKKVNYDFPLQNIYNEILDEMKTKKKMQTKPVSRPAQKEPEIKPQKVKDVERVEEEVRFIKRYALMHGKIKTSAQILTFLNTIQKAILEKRIRKASPYAKEIQYIQSNLAKLYNVMKDKAEIQVNKDILKRFLTIAGSEKVRLSITYLKRYVGIQGKKMTKEKAQRLLEHMKGAVAKRKITRDDPYAERLNEAYESLLKFIQKAKANDTLEIHPAILNGINKALDGCGCENELSGTDEPEPAKVQAPGALMNSMDFANLKFDTLGFTGKWKELIGDPAKGFTAMVYGKPKMGKSYLCIDFAGYLARHHGNTLYVAKEEKLDKTLQDKLNDKNVKHPNLFVSDHLPDDLSPYQFIFLDSVNKLGLQPEDLERLKAQNPGKSFIYVFQTTKEGNFRGGNEFQHDVDIVIQVPERGKAVQFGRFNQGGEIEIFSSGIQKTNQTEQAPESACSFRYSKKI